MSTTVRNARLTVPGEPISRRAAAGRRTFTQRLANWAAARPALASIALTVVYIGTLAGLVATLAASALETPIGFVALVMYAAMVVVCMAVAAYVVTPEKRTA